MIVVIFICIKYSNIAIIIQKQVKESVNYEGWNPLNYRHSLKATSEIANPPCDRCSLSLSLSL